jgi:hypothetical protein
MYHNNRTSIVQKKLRSQEMKILENKIILEPTCCTWCGGTGKKDEYVNCPNQYKTVMGFKDRKCPICGATRKDGHHQIQTGKMVTCGSCDGAGIKMEDRYDFITREIWQSLPFKVFRSGREQTWGESYLGTSLGSCTDYGRYKTLTDEQIIAKVRTEHSFGQVVAIADENLHVAEFIGIFCSDNGYSLLAVKNGKVLDTIGVKSISLA